MKIIFSLRILTLLFVMSLAGSAFAGWADASSCIDESNAATFFSDHGAAHPEADCDHCASCHQHHSHAFLSTITAQFERASAERHYWLAAVYLSQLHYPPSKPPKA